MTSTAPSVIKKSDPGRVEITWSDGHVSSFTAADLRRVCPCAVCVNELSGVRMHNPASVADDLRQDRLALVGHYAITMTFSDGHHTGIYTFPFLRQVDPAQRKPV